MFGYISFKVRVLLGFGAVLFLMAVIALFSYFNGKKSEAALAGIDRKTLPHALLASDMARDIVQVQQFLTDVSATHNPVGYEEADKYARDFKEGLAKFRQLAGDDAGKLKKLAVIEQDFDQFYADGKRMATAYVNNGIEAGNQIMEQFDQSSINLSNRMEALRDAEVKDATILVHGLSQSTKTVTKLLFALTALSIIFGLGIAFYLVRYLSLQLGVDPLYAKSIAKEIAEGNFNRDIRLEPGDTKSLLYALKDMQHQLRERLDQEKDMQRELRERMEHEARGRQSALRIQMALNKTSSNIMMVDEKYNIIYMNEALKEFFRQANNDLRGEITGFNANHLLGANLSIFQKNPAFQRDTLETMQTSAKSSLVIGGRYLDVVANPVIDDKGHRIGTVIEWKDRTHEIKIENEIRTIVDAVKGGELSRRLSTADKAGFFQMLSTNINDLTSVIENVFSDIANVMRSVAEGDLSQRISNGYEGVYGSCKNDINATVDKLRDRIEREAKEKQSALRIQMALDKTSTNVMMADEKHNIIYMNEAIMGLFREAQNEFRRELPQFDINKLVGTSINLFHKKSDNQQINLDTLWTTVKSSVDIGGRNIDFIANPVLDDAGRRVGTVIEWKDRTHEIKIENEIRAIVDAVKCGELGHRLSTADKDGFFQMLSTNINDLTQVIESVFSDIANVIRGMAEGDLSQRISNGYEGVYGSCKNDINATVDKLHDVFSQIQEAANTIAQYSNEIAVGNNDLSNRAEQQAASLEETATSMEQMTGAVKDNAEYAQQANQEATHARQFAEQGSQVADSAINAMLVINESNKKIGDIIGVIDEIALQTNILALNASVEAARAGEQGRGFAVVASEVRNLAQRSATAAKEIKALISDSVEKIDDGGKLVGEAGTSLNEIVEGFKHLNDIIAQIASAGDQQFQGIKQINLTVAQMDDITQQNAALAEQTAAASMSMTEQTTHMRNLLAFFRLGGGAIPDGETSPQPLNIPAKKKLAVPKKSPQTTSHGSGNDQWEEF